MVQDSNERTTVRLSYTRSEQTPDVDEAPSVETYDVENVIAQRMGNSLFLRYTEPSTDGSQSKSDETRTTLRVDPDALTMIRHGGVEWSHTFRVGTSQTSSMRIGMMQLPIETRTHKLDLQLAGYAGTVDLAYDIDIAGEVRNVILGIRFR